MNTNENFVELFRQFAEEKFKQHLRELNTVYANRQDPSAGPMEKAVSDHRIIYEQEIQDKIDTLFVTGSPWLHSKLQDIKRIYLEKLHEMESLTSF